MAYDEHLAERMRGMLEAEADIREKVMFGGIAFMLNGNMSVGIIKDDLMVRVGPDAYEDLLDEPHARIMDFNGRPMKGYVFVGPEGTGSDDDLRRWIEFGLELLSFTAREVGHAGKALQMDLSLREPARGSRSSPGVLAAWAQLFAGTTSPKAGRSWSSPVPHRSRSASTSTCRSALRDAAVREAFATLVVGGELSEVVAFNNAAVLGPIGPVENSSPADIVAHMNVNVVSATMFACAVLRGLSGTTTAPRRSSTSPAEPRPGAWPDGRSTARARPRWRTTCGRSRSSSRGGSIRSRAINVNPGVMDTDMQEAGARRLRRGTSPTWSTTCACMRRAVLADPRTVAERIAELVASRPEAGRTYSVHD